MKLFHLKQEQFLPISLRESWAFFSNPENLEEITPPNMNFHIMQTSGKEIYQGQLIRYRIQLLPLISVTWLTEITAVKEHEYFIDDQRVGPYALWHHHHRFREVDGGVQMTDEVTYALPFGWLGLWSHGLFVGPRLKAIFEYRRSVLQEKFAVRKQ